MLSLIRFIVILLVFYVTRHFRRLKHLYLYNKHRELIERIYHPVLNKSLIYFSKLPAAGQRRFMKRVYLFQKSKRFIGRDGVKVTDEIKCLISASAIQLTFGLKKYLLKHFGVVVLYPQPYFSKVLGMRLKGSASRNGIIAFSLIDYYDGYMSEEDNLNLGLHEMAHALEIENEQFENPEIDFNTWRRLTQYEYMYIREGNRNWLRKYASQNSYEFFAVVIESFFESPQIMELELPEVYYATCVLLNQDPCHPELGYKLSDTRRSELKRKADAAIQIKRACV